MISDLLTSNGINRCIDHLFDSNNYYNYAFYKYNPNPNTPTLLKLLLTKTDNSTISSDSEEIIYNSSDAVGIRYKFTTSSSEFTIKKLQLINNMSLTDTPEYECMLDINDLNISGVVINSTTVSGLVEVIINLSTNSIPFISNKLLNSNYQYLGNHNYYIKYIRLSDSFNSYDYVLDDSVVTAYTNGFVIKLSNYANNLSQKSIISISLIASDGTNEEVICTNSVNYSNRLSDFPELLLNDYSISCEIKI